MDKNSSKKWEQEFSENINNKLLTKQDVEDLLNKYTKKNKFLPKYIEVKNLEVYQEAFVHKSYKKEQNNLNDIDENIFIPESTNELFEFVGDSIIYAVAGTYLNKRFSKYGSNEGVLTKIRIKLIRTECLSDWALKLGFDSYLLISSHMEKLENKKQGRNNENMLENSFEAFIGSIIEDNYPNVGLGFSIAYGFIVGIIETFCDFTDIILLNDNFKDSISRYFSANKLGSPEFFEVRKDGKSNNHIYYVALVIKKTLVTDTEIIDRIKEYEPRAFSILGLDTSNKDTMKNEAPFFEKLKTHYCIGSGYNSILKRAKQEASKRGLLNLNIKLSF